MPITPQEVADKRTEATVNKLCNLIDRKLVETDEPFPFTFNFLPKTSPVVANLVEDVYKRAGWKTSVYMHRVGATEEEKSEKEYPVLHLNRTGIENSSDLTLNKTKNKNDSNAPFQPEKSAIDINAQRESVIKLALETADGRRALAWAMYEPIKTSLLYHSNVRKMLLLDEISDRKDLYTNLSVPPDKESLYWDGEKVVKNPKPYTISKEFIVEKQESRGFHIIDRLQVYLKDFVQQEEEKAFVSMIEECTKDDIIQTYPETLDKAIRESFGIVCMDNIPPAKMFLNPKNFYKYISSDKANFEQASQRDAIMTGLMGHYGNIVDVHISSNCPENTIYIFAVSSYVGSLRYCKNEDIRISDVVVTPSSVSAKIESESTMSIVKDNRIQKIIIRD